MRLLEANPGKKKGEEMIYPRREDLKHKTWRNDKTLLRLLGYKIREESDGRPRTPNPVEGTMKLRRLEERKRDPSLKPQKTGRKEKTKKEISERRQKENADYHENNLGAERAARRRALIQQNQNTYYEYTQGWNNLSEHLGTDCRLDRSRIFDPW